MSEATTIWLRQHSRQTSATAAYSVQSKDHDALRSTKMRTMKVVDDEDGTVTNMDRLLTKEEVAELLGVKVTWLNSEIQAGRIPHLRLGSRKFIRFTREQVDEFLDSRTVNVTAGGND